MGSRVLGFAVCLCLCLLGALPQAAAAAPAAAAGASPLHRLPVEAKAPAGAGRRDHVLAGRGAAPRTSIPGTTSEAYTAQVQYRVGSFPAVSRDADVAALGSGGADDPPDTYLAVGRSYVAETVNEVLAVTTRGGVLVSRTKLSSIFGLPAGKFAADPRVTYDPASDRWFLSIDELDYSFASTIMLAVSRTSDPTGGWYVNSLETSSNPITLDQPKVGIGSDKVVVTWDGYSCGSTTCVPSGQEIKVLEKSDLLAGGTVRSTYFGPDVKRRAAVPAQAATPGPVIYLTYTNADPSFNQGTAGPTLGVVSITGTPAAGNVAITETDPTVQPMTAPPNADQLGGKPLEVNDSRITGAVVRDGVLWAVANEGCIPPGDTTTRPCVRLFQLDLSGGTRLLQDFDTAELGGAFLYPAVALDAANNLFVTFSESSGSTYANLVATGEAAVDAPGSLRPLMQYAAGQQPYKCGPCDANGPQRFGDYSGAVVDPVYPTTVWLAGEYAAAGSATNWGTEIGAFAFATPPPVTAVVGTDHALWTRGPGGGFTSLGGVLAGAPAVLTQKDSSGALNHLYLAPGSNHDLYVRSDSLDWQPLDFDHPVGCFDSVGAEIDGNGVLVVACQGGDHALWYARGQLPNSGLPTMSVAQWSSLGGALAAGPAVANGPNGPDFFVLGTNNRVYERSLVAGYVQQPWGCFGHPAAASTSAATYFACDGLDGALWVATRDGAGWHGAVSLGGRLVDGPGIAARGAAVTYYVEGADRSIWTRTPTLGFSDLGGVVVGGAAGAG